MVNLGRGTPEQAAAEAKFVVPTLGTKLIALQIGNEPNLYGKHFRPPSYSFSDYMADWNRFAAAVLQAVPAAKFAGPDVAGAPEWVAQFAKQRPADTVLLTGHYYAEGPPSDPRMTFDFLMRPTPALPREIPIVMQASQDAKLPYRMAEGNSCYWGGKPGVSDVFASALWSGDYMLQLARAGYSGVNLHGGGTGVYTPIAGDIESGFSVRPVFCGMELATAFSGATFLETNFDVSGRNITSYVARKRDRILVAVFNKSDSDVKLRILPHETDHIESYAELKAPSLQSKQDVSFTSSSIPAHEYRPLVAANRAVLLQLRSR